MLVSHACFLIKYQTHREEAVRELADSLLIQLGDKFPQVSFYMMEHISVSSCQAAIVDW